MQTISELRQQLQLISQQLEELSHTPEFQELNQHSQQSCDGEQRDFVNFNPNIAIANKKNQWHFIKEYI